MKVTRTHLHALMLDPQRSILVADGERLSVTSPGQFLADGRGRLLITAADLRDAGVRLTRGGGRFAAGAGPIVDDLVAHVNGLLTAVQAQ
ncbi:hypothetical protein [Gordonia sihwensis]|uniref:hypothetical protein n=1 Tax=Gordonia sihwensis TaxID=173559 RepID=UPI000AB7D173|nr:hypothetical protein [Gordonia sihwensis]